MSRPKLLLADDSVTIRKVVELTFADEGIEVTTAADGASAMERFVETQPDIVLVDATLPGTSGFQICEMIKGDEATRRIPVLLLVGSFEPFDSAEAERIGADGFLTKPFQSIRDLVARVKGLLDENSDQHGDEPEHISAADEAAPSSAAEAPDAESLNTHRHETKDIDDLYQTSFAATEEAAGEKAGFPDTELDDEMIEASYLSGAESETFEGARTKEFEWSPSSLLSEPLYTSEADPEERQPPAADDAASKDAAEEGTDLSDTSDSEYGEPPIDHGTSGGEISEEAGSREAGSESEQPAETFTPIDPFAEQADAHVESTSIQENVVQEPTPEFVALVAKLVVERLSDQAIREIAREAVPRITEKLIREALAEEKK